MTKWEAEFYSYIAAQHHKSSRAGARGGNDGDGDRDDDDGNSASTASIDTVESDPQNGNRGGGGNGSVATETRRSSTKSARTAEPARTPLAPNLGVPQDSVSSTYFADVDYESFSVDDLIAGDKDDSSSSHFSISSEDIEQDQSQNQSQDQSQDWSQDYSRSQSQNESRRTTLSAVSPSMPPSQASIASHFDNMDFEDDGDVNYGTGDEESAEDNEDEESEEEDDLSGSEGSFGASMRSASKPISPPGESLVHGSVIRAGSALQTSSTDSRRRLDSSESVGFEGFEGIDDDDDESLGDGEVDYNMPSDDEEEDGDEEIPSPPSSADDSAGYMSALLSRATSGIPSSSLPSGVSSPAVPSSSTSTAGRPPLGSQSIDIGDPAGAASSQTLRFEEPIFSADTDCSGDRRDRGESIALSIDLHGHPEEDGEGDEDEDAISSMSEGEIAQARQQLQTTQEENDDAVSVDYSLPSDTE